MKKPSEHNTEFWDLYRADGRFEKVIPSKGYDIPENMYHMTVEVIPSDKAGHMLITQRSFAKKIGPGKLEFPAGSVLSEEQPYVAARRELFEETGLKAASMIKLGEYQIPRIHRTIYLAYIPDLKSAQITLQENETIGYTIATFQQWLEYIAQERFETSKFRHYSAKLLGKIEELVGVPTERQVKEIVLTEMELTTENPFAKYRNSKTDQKTDFSETLEELFSGEEEWP